MHYDRKSGIFSSLEFEGSAPYQEIERLGLPFRATAEQIAFPDPAPAGKAFTDNQIGAALVAELARSAAVFVTAGIETPQGFAGT